MYYYNIIYNYKYKGRCPNLKKILLLLGVFAIMAALSGCTVFETDTEALMKPPVLTAEQEKLNAALREVIGESYTLKYPKNGDMNSAFIFEDLDNDGTQEALAFYSSVDESTRINVLKKEGTGWKSVYEAAGFSGDIEKIDITQLDNKGDVLVVKWEQEAAIYRYISERLESVHRAACSGVEIADINGNGYSEVMVFGGNISGRNSINVVYSNGSEVVISEAVGVHAEYENIYFAKSGLFYGETHAYFIDSLIYDGVYLTEIITLDENEVHRKFVADFVEYEDESETEKEPEGDIVIVGGDYGKRGIFLRNTKVYCMDTNKNGIIEMPVEVREDYAQSASDEIFLIQYMEYNGETSVPVWNGVPNTEKGYIFAIPESWNQKVMVTLSGDDLVLTEKSTGEEILIVHSVLKSDYQDKYEDYILGADDGANNYYVELKAEPETEFYLDPEIIETSFIFI